MFSSWGLSFGNSWGNSWGDITDVSVSTPETRRIVLFYQNRKILFNEESRHIEIFLTKQTKIQLASQNRKIELASENRKIQLNLELRVVYLKIK